MGNLFDNLPTMSAVARAVISSPEIASADVLSVPGHGDFEGTNGDPVTPEEVRAIQSLARLAKRWPKTLKLVSMGGGLRVVHAADERYRAVSAVERGEAVLYTFDGIPNDGGDW